MPALCCSWALGRNDGLCFSLAACWAVLFASHAGDLDRVPAYRKIHVRSCLYDHRDIACEVGNHRADCLGAVLSYEPMDPPRDEACRSATDHLSQAVRPPMDYRLMNRTMPVPFQPSQMVSRGLPCSWVRPIRASPGV